MLPGPSHDVDQKSPDLDPDVEDAYGDIAEQETGSAARKKRDFAPWHHPVKQVVRRDQWGHQIERLIRDGHVSNATLRYFTLPGADMMDVRYLGNRLRGLPEGPWRLEVFGFDRTAQEPEEGGTSAEPEALSILRQDDLITMASQLVPGQLEEIAYPESVARRNLDRSGTFDVINLDACSHLCHQIGETRISLFAAFQRLMEHQLRRQLPWVLLITTRADKVNFSGPPAEGLRKAILNNIEKGGAVFMDALRATMKSESDAADGGAEAAWASKGEQFLKIFTIGFGKHLLQWFNTQFGRRSEVELKSTFAYRVAGDDPDMLALAFRVTPVRDAPLPAMNGGQIELPPTEPELGARIARRADRMMNVDARMEDDAKLRQSIIQEKANLLRAINYPIDAWIEWLKTHRIRPIDCSDLLPDQPK